MGNGKAFWNQLPASGAKSGLLSKPSAQPPALFLIVPYRGLWATAAVCGRTQ